MFLRVIHLYIKTRHMLFEVEITQCLAYWHSVSLDKPYFLQTI